MMANKINPSFRLILIILLLCIATSIESAVERKKQILILHSYHQGLEWTDNISRGVRSVFNPLQQQYEIHYEYLDTKRNSGEAYMDKISRMVSEKNIMAKYELIITSDNHALDLLNTGKITFQGDPPIVFCGINNFDNSMISNLRHVTGVVEATDIKGTLDLMMQLHPRRNHVIIVMDRTFTGDAIREEFRGLEDSYRSKLDFEFIRDFSLEEIPEKLAHLDDNDIIYVLTFNRDKNGTFISYTEGIEILSRSSNVPIYGSWDFYMGKGIIGGSITSGYMQGVEAAKMAIMILRGMDAKEIKISKDPPTEYMFDYRLLQKYNVDRTLLPKYSRIINASPSTYERYKPILTWIIGALLIILLLLTWKYFRQQTMLKKEKALALELDKMVRERTRELEQSNMELQRLSNQDGLTQIYNRRYFDNFLAQEINRLQRSSSPISLLLCDIDHFKQYNDTHGHLAGDDCLKTIANVMRQNCKRVIDIVARYGGEEFAVILSNTDADNAVIIANAIRTGVESACITHLPPGSKEIISISIGIASIIPDKQTISSELIAIADKALYESKRGGRNRVTLLSSIA